MFPKGDEVVDYLKEAEEELRSYNDFSNSLISIKEELEIIDSELKNVKTMNYDSIPGSCAVQSDDRIVNLIYKKQVKEESYELTLAKVRHIQKIFEMLCDSNDKQNIDAELLKQYYLDQNQIADICDDLKVSERTFRRRKYIALRRFARQLFGIKTY